MWIAALWEHVRLSHKQYTRSPQHMLRLFRAIKHSHIKHNPIRPLRQLIAQRGQQRNLMAHVWKQAIQRQQQVTARPRPAILHQAIVLLATGQQRQLIALLVQQRNLTAHVWSHLALHILAMIAALATVAGLAIAVAHLAMVAARAIAAEHQQIAQPEQQRNLTAPVWKADRLLIAMPIRVHLLSFTQVTPRQHRLMDMDLMVASARQITCPFASKLL